MKLSRFSTGNLLRMAAPAVLACLTLSWARPLQAAALSISAADATVSPGAEIVADVKLASGGQAINALEGSLTYPSDHLRLESIKDGTSFVSFWVVRPHEDGSGKIAFSGIVPGGYTGSSGTVFSAVFRADNEGPAQLALATARVLLNDGKGTAAPLTSVPFTVTIALAAPAATKVISKDQAPPETFTPKVARDPTTLDGKWFVAFGTQDKDSGIDHYEVQETPQNGLPASASSSATSPYVLEDQGRQSLIEIKAVDREGNIRLASVPPAHPTPWYDRPFAWLVAFFGLLFAVALKLRHLRKPARTGASSR